MTRPARRRARRAAAGFFAAALLLAGALYPGAPDQALAEKEQPGIRLEVDERIELARVDAVALPARTDPASIETGIPCGMLEMCGQDPCLCGSVDQWGACACNGTHDTRPVYTMSCDDEGIVAVVDLFGTSYLVALGTGETDAVLRAELPHHDAGEAQVHVEVAPFGPLDAAKLLGALALALGVLAGLAAGVRAAVRGIGRLVRRIEDRRGTSV